MSADYEPILSFARERFSATAVLCFRDVAKTSRYNGFVILLEPRGAERIREIIGEIVLDVTAAGVEWFKTEIRRSQSHQLIQMIAAAVPVGGDVAAAQSLISFATRTLTQPPPHYPAHLIFRFRNQPHDLLEDFERSRNSDLAVSALIAATLMKTIVDGYFILNRLWMPPDSEAIAAIEERAPQLAAELRIVAAIPVERLWSDAAPLERLVRIAIGSTATSVQKAVAPPPVASPMLVRKVPGGAVASRALRSYEVGASSNDGRDSFVLGA